jgi:succinoglycan biosynthesis transport protein ExoP
LIGGHSNLPTDSMEQPQYAMPFPSPGAEEGGGGFSLEQVWHMLRAHLWLSIALFVVMVALAFSVIKWLLPKSYEATAALIVNSNSTDPLAGRNQPLGLTYTFFPTQIELINNNVVLRPVVDRLKLQSDPRFTQGSVSDPKTLNDDTLEKLRLSLKVQPGTNSELLYISATARDPGLSADIANAVAEEYLHQISQRTNAPAIERATRYSEQLEELKNKVDAAQAKVSEFRQQHGMADLKEGQGGDQEGTALADLQDKLLQAQNARRLLESRPGDARAESTAVLGAPEAVTLRGELDKLESEMSQARTTFGPQHPRVLQLQSEIDAARNALRSSASARLAGARDLEARFQAAVNNERNRLVERRALQDEGAKLLLELQAAKETYSQALRGMDQVQFASVGNYKDVTLVSRAEPPLKSSKPNKLKLLLMAIAASLAFAVGGPFAYELLLDRRIRCRDDLERHFRVVTLAQFGPMDPAPAN